MATPKTALPKRPVSPLGTKTMPAAPGARVSPLGTKTMPTLSRVPVSPLGAKTMPTLTRGTSISRGRALGLEKKRLGLRSAATLAGKSMSRKAPKGK